MSPTDKTLVVAGLGLIGGSLAKALRASGYCRHFIGFGHRTPSLERGVELGVIDEFTLDLDEAVARADILAICTPTRVAAQLLGEILPRLAASKSAAIVTDAASVKGNLRDAALAACAEVPGRLVLGHPIAGSELSGVDAANAQLFRAHRVILTPLENTDAKALAEVEAMWRSTGAELMRMGVDEHDAVLAATSHLPHVLAYALVDALATADSAEQMFRCAAGGFRDFTRIASSDPVMWRDIALANGPALLQAIDHYTGHLTRLRVAIADADGDALLETFTQAKRARDAFADELAQRADGTIE